MSILLIGTAFAGGSWSDDFSDNDISDWTVVDGSWSVSSGIISGSSSSHYGPDLVVDPGMDDGVQNYTVTYNIAGSTSFGVVPAYGGSSSYYCNLFWWAGSTLYLTNSSTGETSQGSHSWSYSTYYEVVAEVDIASSNVDIYEDGSLIWSGDLGCSAFTATGEVGLGLHSGGTAYLDDITVEWEYVDNDGDGYTEDDNDCDDADADINPGETETWYDGTDSDCDGASDYDADGDGEDSDAYGGDDCDDGDASINTTATEVCDGVDNDCDGTADNDDASDADTWYRDADEDGFGDADNSTQACNQPSGYLDNNSDCDDADEDTHPAAAPNDSASACMTDADGDDYGDDGASGDVTAGTDCDDTDASVNPGVAEVTADGVDNDCDDIEVCYTDDDADGYGDSDTVDSSDLDCTDSGEADDSDDCDDDDATVYDGATELCDGQDNDCDGSLPGVEVDNDGDGYVECTEDADGWDGASSVDFEDCNDGAASAYPGADEYCDGIDNDCEGDIDEDDALDVLTWYADSDGDGYGDAAVTDAECEQPSGYVGDDTDCDDSDAASYPGAVEVAYDGIDQDCDGADLCDVDGDGFDSEECPDGEDCDDSDDEIHPDAEEIFYDDVDQDCDAESDYDADGDGYDSASYGGEDCDDADADTYPGAPDEPYDGEITDCDAADEYDQDGDGFEGGDDGSDCDDANSDIHPGAEDIPDDGIDQDCDGEDATLEVGDTASDTGISDTGLSTDKGGCSCAMARNSSIFVLIFGGLLWGRRRRR